MLFKIGASKSFATFTDKHLCWSIFFNFINFTKLELQEKEVQKD